ncbi:proteasome-type protease [Qipengyuania sp. SS22]|uniref:proteasome-type protease n=1 Tax=Qipengyuania sp. SS22 TaxID=2979461 RepID=UPI0021E5F6ED|nr:proteasome-type protease [Qipengyuania sp. SS22]UYH53903.1 proteasome-type protease [Qipengyuania sp. SS22]
MTYCVGMVLDTGLVLMSDTRTNSGVDNISVFRKMFTWNVPGERIITVMTAGNLASTQAVISQLEERMKEPDERDNIILQSPTMFQVVTEIGKLLRSIIADRQEANGVKGRGRFTASIIVAGQIAGMEPRLFMVYPEGNFIEASHDTPFFQIGETKYGRPIIIRGYDRTMSLEDAVKLLMVSFDSTLKANLSVGLPLDLQVIERDVFEPKHEHRVNHDDPYFQAISSSWGDALKSAFHSLPDYSFYRSED